jgi:small subunit ribosomal protein S17
MAEETTAATPSGAAVTTPTGTERSNNRKIRDGVVMSSKMDRTAVVLVTSRVRHPRYNKTVQRSSRMYVDDPANDLNAGDRVRIQETRPLSKLKRWRLLQVLERAR